MKHVKEYQELFESLTSLTPDQIKWLLKNTWSTWSLNTETGLVDVEGDFLCGGESLTDFKGVKFGTVKGNFTCHNSKLYSLEGAPQQVGGDFYCHGNKLATLKHAPQQVGGDFYCFGNDLVSLEGAPNEVGGVFNCSKNKLASLNYAPNKVGVSKSSSRSPEIYTFDCSQNNLVSLEGAPNELPEGFSCSNNRLDSLEHAPYKIGGNFNCANNKLTSLEYAPNEVGLNFNCSNNDIVSLEGLPKKIGRSFSGTTGNRVSSPTLNALYLNMKHGMGWKEAVEMTWDYINNEKDEILLAQYNPNFTDDDKKYYSMLGILRKRII